MYLCNGYLRPHTFRLIISIMKQLIVILLTMLTSMLSANGETYVVNSGTLNVRNSPSTTGKIIGSLQRGLEIEVIEVTNGFAKFDFMGQTGYSSIKYMKPITKTNPSTGDLDSRDGGKKAVPAETAIVYLFYDVKHYFKSFPISINGQYAFGMEGEPTTGKMTGTRYTKSMRKINVHGEGKMVISLDFTLAEKPYHSELALNVSDEGVYYVKIYMEKIWNAFTKKRTGLEMKQLFLKEGLKELQSDKYTVNPDAEIVL